MLTLLYLGMAGACGTLARYGLDCGARRIWGEEYGWGILIANVLGCFLFALVFSWSSHRGWPDPAHRMLILTGFMGAFTTFSTYIVDAMRMAQSGQSHVMLLHLCGQIALGMLAAFAGFRLGCGGLDPIPAA